MKTYSPKPEHIERSWYVVDASGMVLGRFASGVAALLRGKHKPIFAPHMDCGDHVIVINADKVELTGGKELKKFAHRHSGYPGGITSTRYGDLMADKPVFVVEKAIRGMLPKNRLGRAMIKKLHVVAGPEHPHEAQQPVPYTLGEPPMWEGLPEPRVRAPRMPKAQMAPAPKAPAKKPTAKKPTAKKPAAKKPAAKKPAAKSTNKPAGKKSAKAATSAPESVPESE
jgi:large subunit ribosomal protein L13